MLKRYATAIIYPIIFQFSNFIILDLLLFLKKKVSLVTIKSVAKRNSANLIEVTVQTDNRLNSIKQN